MARTLPTHADLVRELVAIPSISSADPRLDRPNRAVIDRLADYCDSLGLRVSVLPIPSRPEKANLVATLGDGDDGLVLAGHTDTVPFDEGRWTHDPFAATIEDGIIYGLGTADMKGFFAAALHAVRRFDARTLKRPLHLVGTADEESSMAGARALLDARVPTARHVIVGEPTGLVPVRAHKGVLMERIVIEGRSGHSSNPALGASAIEGMHAAIGALLAMRDDLAAAHRDESFEVPTPTMNLGRVDGGDAPNRIAARCELVIDIRATPGLDAAELRAELKRRVEAAIAGRGLIARVAPLFDGVPAFAIDPSADLVRAAEEETGHAARAVLFGTECPFFQRMGMDAIVLGPGDISVAHQPDEHVAIEALERATELFAKLVHRFCVS